MKVLKLLGILLLVVVVIGLIASLILPKEINVHAEDSIDAPISIVWDNISSFEKADNWSPWYDVDENMKVSFDGESGAVGSKMMWSGNKEVGSGTMTLTTSDVENHVIENHIKHEWGEGDAKMQLSEEEGKTKIVYTYVEKQGMPWNIMGALMGAGDMMTEIFVKELGSLKDVAEKEAKTPVEVVYTVEEIQREAVQYLGKKEVVKMADMKTYFEENMGVYAEQAGENMIGTPSALYWSRDDETKQSEMTAAMPVNMTEAPEGYELYEQPEGTYLVIDYFGSYEGLEGPHKTMGAYLDSHNLQMVGAVMEEYITDPMSEEDPSKWLTKIVYPIATAAPATEN
ncbi:MAG: effector-binding domain-containing protein [Bacteroidia bacterium]|jgi:effector-binding domain-containing protein